MLNLHNKIFYQNISKKDVKLKRQFIVYQHIVAQLLVKHECH